MGSAMAPQIGHFTIQGWKPNQPNWVSQDCHLKLLLPGDRVLLGVFDGHGAYGHQLSHRIKDLFANMALGVASAADTNAAFRNAFARCQSQIEIDGNCDDSGSTATLALVDHIEQTVSFAHVGDSAALLIRPDGSVVFRTQDHKPEVERESQRLSCHGAQVVNGRLTSGNRSFALSRSIGDVRYSHQGKLSEPEVVCGLPFKPGYALTLASDGVWDVLSKDEVGSAVARLSAQEAAEFIVQAASSKWSHHTYMDDITGLVLKSWLLGTASDVKIPVPLHSDGGCLAAIVDGHESKGRQLSRRIKDFFASMAYMAHSICHRL